MDLGVLAGPPLSLDELTRRQADLRQATRAPIELISLDVAPVVLAHEVLESGVCLFARDTRSGRLGSDLLLPRCQDLEPEHPCAVRLGRIIRHETSEPQLVQGGQVKAVKRATVKIAGIPMLAKGRLEDGSG